MEKTQDFIPPPTKHKRLIILILIAVVVVGFGIFRIVNSRLFPPFMSRLLPPFMVNFQRTNAVIPYDIQQPILEKNYRAPILPTEKPPSRRLMMEKKIDGGRLAAYRLTDNLSSEYRDIFAVVMEVGNEYTPTIFSVSSSAFTEDGVMETVNNELLIVNGQTNKIDRYGYEIEKIVNNISYLNSLEYISSISLPNYRLGQVYSIKCVEQLCKMRSAFHQESGCRMDYNLKTNLYSNIECSDHTGEFSPTPL